MSLRAQLWSASTLKRKHDHHNGIPRLYVDRVFSMTGFGAVVTGTLMGGVITANNG